MAITTLTWCYLIFSSISAVINLLLFFLLLANFLQRKTVGTMILSLSFVVTAIAESLFSITFWIQAFSESVPVEITGVIYYIGVIILAINTYFYYFFGNRFIIKDNDIAKSLIALVFSLIEGLSLGLGITYILNGFINPGICVIGYLPGTELTMYIIGYYLGIAIIPISVFFVFGRIIFKGVAMQRRTKDIIAKKGLTFVLTASILHILGAATRTIGFWFEVVRVRPILAVSIFAFGVITTIAALTLYYLGWVMPNWLKRRLREQAWFTKIYTGKIAEPIELKVDTGTEISINNVIEVNEK